MYKFILVACVTSLFVSCNSESTTETVSKDSASASTSKDNDGWVSLFDGKTTEGWHKYGGGAVGSAWKIADGILYLDTSAKKDFQMESGGDIATNEEFENYHLKLDWKISPNGNSGIIFNVHEDTAFQYSFESGPEMQIVDDQGHPDGKIFKHQSGDLYDLIAGNKKTVKPVGEWNHVEIKVLNGLLELSLNGEVIVTTTMWDDNWKKLIDGSKFKALPGFGTFKKGRIALQDHGNMVWFRDIQIRKL